MSQSRESQRWRHACCSRATWLRRRQPARRQGLEGCSVNALESEGRDLLPDVDRPADARRALEEDAVCCTLQSSSRVPAVEIKDAAVRTGRSGRSSYWRAKEMAVVCSGRARELPPLPSRTVREPQAHPLSRSSRALRSSSRACRASTGSSTFGNSSPATWLDREMRINASLVFSRLAHAVGHVVIRGLYVSGAEVGHLRTDCPCEEER